MRLVTFNILHGRSLGDGQVDLGRLASAIRGLDPDLLALQEVDRAQPRSHHADLTEVAAAAMGALDQRFVPMLAGGAPGAGVAGMDPDDPGTAAYGVSLLSRYPATAWQVLPLPRVAVPIPRWDPTTRRLRLALEEPRAAVAGQFETPAGPLTAVSTHLSFLPGWGHLQLLALRGALLRVPGPLVLMGDLNLARLGPARLTGYRSLARHVTFPRDRPTRQLDHILARGPVGPVVASSAPALDVSDHRALVVELGSR